MNITTSNIVPELIIVEGPDNVGKDFVINIINEIFQEYYNNKNNWYNSVLNIHCLKPVYSSTIPDENKVDYTTKMYKNIMGHCLLKLVDTDAIIMNRSYLSEFVYGYIYRGMTFEERDKQLQIISDSIFNTIYYNQSEMPSDFYKKSDEELKKAIYDNILYLQLTAPKEWLLLHDDGKSQSENDELLIKMELDNFECLYQKEFPFSKAKLETVEYVYEQTNPYPHIEWKSKETLTRELKRILNIEHE